jgi:hypothetical protein
MHVSVEVRFDVLGVRRVFSREIHSIGRIACPSASLPLANSQQLALYERRRRVGARSMVPKQAGGQGGPSPANAARINPHASAKKRFACLRASRVLDMHTGGEKPAFPFEFCRCSLNSVYRSLDANYCIGGISLNAWHQQGLKRKSRSGRVCVAKM